MKDDIIRMAQEAGFGGFLEPNWDLREELERFAALVAAAEREACAKAAEEYMRECEGASFGIGEAIRARGQA